MRVIKHRCKHGTILSAGAVMPPSTHGLTRPDVFRMFSVASLGSGTSQSQVPSPAGHPIHSLCRSWQAADQFDLASGCAEQITYSSRCQPHARSPLVRSATANSNRLLRLDLDLRIFAFSIAIPSVSKMKTLAAESPYGNRQAPPFRDTTCCMLQHIRQHVTPSSHKGSI